MYVLCHCVSPPQNNVAWAAAQGVWLQSEAAAMDLEGEGDDGGDGDGAEDGGGGGAGDGEEAGAVPELADEVVAEVEGVQASVQETMVGGRGAGAGVGRQERRKGERG